MSETKQVLFRVDSDKLKVLDDKLSRLDGGEVSRQHFFNTLIDMYVDNKIDIDDYLVKPDNESLSYELSQVKHRLELLENMMSELVSKKVDNIDDNVNDNLDCDFDSMTKDQLKFELNKRGIKYTAKMRNDVLKQMLVEDVSNN